MHSIGILENDFTLKNTLQDYLTSQGEYEISFSFGSFGELSKLRNKATIVPDFILLDIHLDDVLGIFIIPELKTMFPKTEVIVITGDSDNLMLLKAVQHGASSYLPKPFTMKKLHEVIENVESTGSFLTPETLTKLMHLINVTNSKKSSSSYADSLTERENQIFELMKKGMTYKEMASLLNVSYHTVNHHLKNIYLKLDVNSKVELLSKFL